LPNPGIYSTIRVLTDADLYKPMSLLRFYFFFYFSYPSLEAVEKR